MTQPLTAPFPYFGGKSRIAHEVWARFGDVKNYVEPFFGSGAVLLARPSAPGIETVNDADGFVSNFWRAVQADPDAVAHYADWPVNECDLTARHYWLVGRRTELVERLEGDPGYYDAQIAGWWCWGMCAWIGAGWCAGGGPWHVEDGRMVRGNAGRGINRQLPYVAGVGRGINRDTGSADRGEWIREWFQALAARMRDVRVCCGDWARVATPTVTANLGLTGVFLDPPYSADADRTMGVYAEDSGTVAHAAREWAVAHGDDPRMRIALCGYEGEHAMPESWRVLAWKAKGGFGNQGTGRALANAHRERIWFSPHCLTPETGQLECGNG